MYIYYGYNIYLCAHITLDDDDRYPFVFKILHDHDKWIKSMHDKQMDV